MDWELKPGVAEVLEKLWKVVGPLPLEETLETLLGFMGPLFDDNVDDIQEAPTSMMDHW